jgi:hypothetical protein
MLRIAQGLAQLNDIGQVLFNRLLSITLIDRQLIKKKRNSLLISHQCK